MKAKSATADALIAERKAAGGDATQTDTESAAQKTSAKAKAQPKAGR